MYTVQQGQRVKISKQDREGFRTRSQVGKMTTGSWIGVGILGLIVILVAIGLYRSKKNAAKQPGFAFRFF